MKRIFLSALAAALALGGAANAEGDLSRADIQTVVMEMGSTDDGMYFQPDSFRFETGQAYEWVLKNVDPIKHELAINEMRERIFTRKLEIRNAAGDLIAEIKGDINEVEIGPEQTVSWFFVPVQTGEDIAIECELPGHAEAGMVGTVSLY